MSLSIQIYLFKKPVQQASSFKELFSHSDLAQIRTKANQSSTRPQCIKVSSYGNTCIASYYLTDQKRFLLVILDLEVWHKIYFYNYSARLALATLNCFSLCIYLSLIYFFCCCFIFNILYIKENITVVVFFIFASCLYFVRRAALIKTAN